jgi:hypothetical protein
MASFRLKGFTYDLWVRPWKKGKAKYEALKWVTGMKRPTWERISFEEFEKARLEAGK